MNEAALRERLQALAAGGLKGRRVYGVDAGVDLGPMPPGVAVRRLDGGALVAGRAWPPGAGERRRAIAEAFGGELAEIREAGPLLLIVEAADPLLGELDGLGSIYDRFVRDDRMLIFRCAASIESAILADAPAQLVYRPGAALRRLAETFRIDVIDRVEVAP